MHMLIITDLHNFSEEEYQKVKNLRDYDICFLLGDICPDYLQQLKEIIHTPIYGLNGNHDLMHTVEDAGIENFHGKLIEFKGTTFTGFQGSYRYKNGDFCMYTQKESLEISKHIPKADIFLTHDIYYSGGKYGPHSGLKGITKYIKKNRPLLHVHGHLHTNISSKAPSCFLNFKKTESRGIYKIAIIDTETFEVAHY